MGFSADMGQAGSRPTRYLSRSALFRSLAYGRLRLQLLDIAPYCTMRTKTSEREIAMSQTPHCWGRLTGSQEENRAIRPTTLPTTASSRAVPNPDSNRQQFSTGALPKALITAPVPATSQPWRPKAFEQQPPAKVRLWRSFGTVLDSVQVVLNQGDRIGSGARPASAPGAGTIRI